MPRKAKDHGWKRDPKVTKTGQRGGPPPNGHVRRCQGRNEYLTKRDGKPTQCGRWALIGRDYCGRCGKGRSLWKPKVARGWYSKYAGDALSAKLEEMRSAPPDERISLESEIDVARVLAAQTLQIFDLVVVQGEVGTADEETARVMKAQASIALRDAMSFVAGIIDKAARVRTLSEGTIDVELVGYIVHQVQKVIEKRVVALPNGRAICDLIVEDMQGIKMPQTQHTMVDASDRAREVRGLMAAMDITVMGAEVDDVVGDNGSNNGNGRVIENGRG